MNEQVENEATALDAAKLVLGVLVLIGGIVAFSVFDELAPVLRWLMVLAGLGLGLLIASQSQYGREFFGFVNAARGELRKVVWPTQNETLKTTAVVFVFVLVMGFFFWGLDIVLAWATKILTGQQGS
jgi:preprotein translocase subunit SecE